MTNIAKKVKDTLGDVKDKAVGPMGLVGRPSAGPESAYLWYLGCPGVLCPNPMGHGLS